MKKIFAAFIFVLLLGGTAIAFSYWDENLAATENDITLSVGEATSISVALDGSVSTDKLVPATALVGTGEVTQIVLTYNIKLSKTGASSTYTVAASDVKIGGATTYASLVNINISPASGTITSADTAITITVTLTEPADLAAYTAIASGTITFDLTFTAAAA